MIKSLSSKGWEFLRSDRAILVWASLVGVLCGFVAVLLKNGVSLIRSGIFSAHVSGEGGQLIKPPHFLIQFLAISAILDKSNIFVS